MAGCRVLLVEDNKINRDIASELLEEIGVQVVAADNGKSALGLLQAREEGFFDLIFMDIQMPIMDGCEATRKIRASGGKYRTNIPIIALTANTGDESVTEYIACGINDYVQKPVEAKALAAMILTWAPNTSLKEEYLDAAEVFDDAPQWIKDLSGSHFKTAEGIKYCGSQQVYKEFLTEFVMYAEKTLSELDDGYNRQDSENFGRGVHSVKSFTGSLGNRDLSDMSKDLEKAAEGDDWDFIKRKYNNFRELYGQSVKEASAVIGDEANEMCKEFNNLEHDKIQTAPKTVVIIGNEHTFMVNSVESKLNEAGIETNFALNSSETLEKIRILPTLFLIYVDENFTDDKKKTVFLRDYLVEKQRKIILLGYPNEMQRLKRFIPEELVEKEFPRPINVVELATALNELFAVADIIKKNKVMVIDDYGPSLRMARNWLEVKYEVSTAGSGIQAIKMLTLNTPDLILLDYEMPVCNGRVVYQMLKQDEEFAKIPVMFLTGKNDAKTVREVMELKPAGYMLKTMEPSQIVSTIDDYFEKKKAEGL